MPRAERKIHISLTVSRSELAEIDYMTDKMTPGVTYFRNELVMEAIREAARRRGLIERVSEASILSPAVVPTFGEGEVALRASIVDDSEDFKQ